jgi:hypothetical protein
MGKALTKKILIEYLSTSGPVIVVALVACAFGLLAYKWSSVCEISYARDCGDVRRLPASKESDMINDRFGLQSINGCR